MNVSNTSTYISGFYYDIQKKDKLQSITLHPNQVTSDGGITWTNPTEETDGEGKYPYIKRPIASAILKEDFTVAVANNWADFSGGDTINQLWNSLKPFSPYVKFLGDNVKKMNAAADEARKNGNAAFESMVVDKIDKMIHKAEPYLDKAAEYLNRALVVQGTRFSYYAGTGTSFGNLGMKFIIFADWDESGVFKTVNDQLSELYPYIMGKYVPWDEKNKDNMFNEFLGWQKPPGGFYADVKSLDTVQKGTLKMKFGGFYSISDLVVKDAQLTFSKQMVKDPSNPNKISPLYCEVQITLQPATKYSDDSLRKFVSGAYTSEEVKEIETNLEFKLETIKSMNNALTGNSSVADEVTPFNSSDFANEDYGLTPTEQTEAQREFIENNRFDATSFGDYLSPQ